jgi:exodeoxyribonuclease VII small subunit
MTYKESMDRIEEIIRTIENDEAEFEELSSLIREALGLIKACRTKLKDAEINFQELLSDALFE